MWDPQVRSYGPWVTSTDRTSRPTSGPSIGARGCTPRYEIRVAGRLEDRWAAWFDGLTLAAQDDGTSLIRGPIADQAALHGVLQRLRDLGIPLVSLVRLADLPALPEHRPTDNPTGADS